MTPKIPIAAITDEFSPDLETALDAMHDIGMRAAELRVIWGKNILDLSDEEVQRAVDALQARGFNAISLASPLLKCVLPGAPEIDSRFQHDVFASKHTFEDQERLTDRAFTIAKRTGARIVRVFSYWRTADPSKCFDAVVRALSDLAARGRMEGLIIGLENEHACNIATAAESSELLNAVDEPNLKLVWDPANAFVSGERSFPDGYALLPKNRIAHVHAKDCIMTGDHTYEWGPLGAMGIDWKGQIAALRADAYNGYLSLETHWPGPNGDKLEGSRICGWNLRGLASA